METNHKAIKSMALQVRMACKTFAMSQEAEAYDFHNNSNLSCMCAIASSVLHKVFKKKGLASKLVQGYFHGGKDDDCENYHCWVKINNKIVDITATQFGNYPDVYITFINNKKYHRPKIVKNAIYYFKDNGWRRRQSPNVKVLNKIISQIK